MRKLFPAVISVAIVLSGKAISAQPGQPGPIEAGSAAIRGRVVDAQSDQPLGDVVVRLYDGRARRGAEVKSNADGIYQFLDIADGEYTVMAWSGTHVRLCYGSAEPYQPRCSTVSVVRDQQRTSVDFRLARGARIRGRVIDPEQRPVADAIVEAGISFGDALMSLGFPARTDRDGNFDLTNVPAGETRVRVAPRHTPNAFRRPDVYYPGVLNVEESATLDVKTGGLITGITVTLPRVAASTVITRISSSETALEGLTATLIGVEPRMVRRIQMTAEGMGAVEGLPDGRYFVSARARSGNHGLAAFEIVDVIQDADILLSLQRAGRITGRIVAERGGLPPIDGVRVAAAWIDSGVEVDPLVPDQVEAGPDGAFSIDGLFGTRTLQLIGLSTEWEVQSVMHGRSDITSTGVDILPDSNVQVTIVLARR